MPLWYTGDHLAQCNDCHCRSQAPSQRQQALSLFAKQLSCMAVKEIAAFGTHRADDHIMQQLHT